MQEEEKRFSLILPLILPLIIFVCVSAISLALLYIKCLPAPLLSDARYLITYLRPPAELSNCLKIPLTRYAGPEIGVTWGQLATFIAFFFAGLGSDSSLLFRLSGLLLHFLAGILVFLTSHALLKSLPSFSAIAGSYLLPFFMALFFSLYPLTVEPTFYLGGRAYQLGLIFLLLSLWLYMRARTHFSWSSLGFAGFAYVLALACDKTMWLASFSFVALFLTAHLLGESRKSEQRKNEPALDLAKTDEMEGAVERLLALEASESEKVKGEVEQESTISDTEKTSEEPTEQTSVKRDEARGTNELFDSLFPALPFIVIAAAACLATLPASPGEQLPKELVVNASDWLRIAKLLFMPINQSITEDYNKAYGYLLYLYIPPLLAVSFALFKSRPFRQHAAFLSIWLVLAVLPHMHQTIESASLTGARWLYHACVPVCGLLALLFFAPVFCVARKKYQALIASTISVVFSLLFLFFLRPLVNKQINSFREAATLTDKICNISRIVAEREAMEYVLVRNIPFKTSIIGTVSPFSIAMLDA
ncbi:MAG: hypothetical protein K8F91_11175, partial [Candidatus Obscuribacterales bacterium]|nr:hypothetical protein [Candidatus Obscuribacterales bacterium]